MFTLDNLKPRGPFRLIGEQIDGSFVWNGRTHLLEAKWTKQSCGGAEFGAFSYKIDGKAADTRGLFISINGYSPQAIQALNSKGALKFVCVDGAHIVRALSVAQSLSGLLERIWRHAEETGDAYLAVSRFG